MIFIDTGPFLAQYSSRDQYHLHGAKYWPDLERPVFTSNHVVDEVATALGRLKGCRFAADRAADIYASSVIDVLCSTRDDEVEALRWMRKYADQRITFTDCVSFAIMRRYKIRTAFTFDHHFRVAGFDVIGLK